ncbi:MAG: hypothetical protein R3351_09925, partial [Nitrospirales bacterium]|nr:hypothetical protein [Nitrospirales bacterium]
MMRLLRSVSTFLGFIIGAFLILITGLWGIGALYFDGPGDDYIRTILASAFGLSSLVALAIWFTGRFRRLAAVAYTITFLALFAWWSMIEPSNDREWQAEVAVLPYATFEGNLVTVHNIRNFDYRTETDFTPAYYDR